MKKILGSLSAVLVVNLAFSLTGCGGKADLIFTEMVEGNGDAMAVEIYNPLDVAVDLSDYTLEVYKNGAEERTGLINLTGTLEAKECYVVVGDYGITTPDELKDKADLLSTELVFNGNDPVFLMKGEEKVSSLGLIPSYGVDFAVNTTLVKVVADSNLGNYEFVESDWIQYPSDTYDHLGTVEHPITLEDLQTGPMLTEEAKAISFFPEGTTSANKLSQRGTGGVVEVTVNAFVDGDTTKFKYPEEFYSSLGLDTHTNRVRYYGIDTPESGGVNGEQYEAFGKTASNYTKSLLENAKTIHLQSIPGQAIFDTYGRILALVYVDGVLLNNLIIQNGYSDTAFSQTDMRYNGIEISAYMTYSTQVARLNGVGIHGEKDPLWDYSNNTPKA